MNSPSCAEQLRSRSPSPKIGLVEERVCSVRWCTPSKGFPVILKASVCNFSFPPSPPSSSFRRNRVADNAPKKRSEGRTEALQHSWMHTLSLPGETDMDQGRVTPSVVTPDDNAEDTCTPAGPPSFRARQPFPAGKRHYDPVLVVELGAPPLQGLVFLRWCRSSPAAGSGSWLKSGPLIHHHRSFRLLAGASSSGCWCSRKLPEHELARTSSISLIFSQLTSPCNSPKTFLDHAFKLCRTSLRQVLSPVHDFHHRGLHCDEAAPAKCRARFPRHAPLPRYGLWYGLRGASHNYCHGAPPLAHSSTRSE